MTDLQSPILHPTLWRTCRSLANMRRLEILTELIHRSPQNVSQVASSLNMSEAVASQYLRHLNARGLIHASRSSRFVSYSARPNPTLNESARLMAALRHAIVKEDATIDHLFNQLTAFTHWRRIQIMQRLAAGECTSTELMKRTGISRIALLRHLKKLAARGYVLFDKQKGSYRCASRKDALAKTLLNLIHTPT